MGFAALLCICCQTCKLQSHFALCSQFAKRPGAKWCKVAPIDFASFAPFCCKARVRARARGKYYYPVQVVRTLVQSFFKKYRVAIYREVRRTAREGIGSRVLMDTWIAGLDFTSGIAVGLLLHAAWCELCSAISRWRSQRAARQYQAMYIIASNKRRHAFWLADYVEQAERERN